MNSDFEKYLSKYQRKKTVINIIMILTLFTILTLFVLYNIYQFHFYIFIAISIALSAIVNAFVLSIWNCPMCGRSFGFNINKKVCKHCGLIYTNQDKNSVEIEELYEGYSDLRNKIDDGNIITVKKILLNKLGINDDNVKSVDEVYKKYLEDKYSLPKLDEESKSIVYYLKLVQIILVVSIVLIFYFFLDDIRIRFLCIGLAGVLPLMQYIQSNITKKIYYPRYAEEKKDENAFYAYQMMMIWAFIIFEVIFLIKIL